MEELDQIISEMDFYFFGAGEHGMGIEDMRKALTATGEEMITALKPGPLATM